MSINAPSMPVKEIIVTTSWDDGHPLDLRIAELLSKYGLKGTFYIPASNSEHTVMNKAEMLEISSQFEIGGHTKNHVDLTRIPADGIFEEIIAGKEIVEDAIGRTLSMFCYPRGHYNELIKEQVKRAGFRGARSASWFHSEYPDDIYCMHPTLHIYPHSALVHTGHLLKEMNFMELADYLLYAKGMSDLKSLSARWLKRIISDGGILHIWGHSWEIEEFQLWSELESIVSHIAQFKNILHLTNGDIVQNRELHGNADKI